MEYMNTPESEYELVFTSSRGSAFQILAESYPFETGKNLLTMFDHESQSVNWMAKRAREKGSKVYSAKFMWPSLKICGDEMMRVLSRKKKRKFDSITGLFVFPVQSRVSGVKYSYKWMSLAKENCWHVLLDAGSLGPKEMESFGLSLFRPDFIISSFYRVFGWDPTGFGCLLIKKSVVSCLRNERNRTDLGIVRIVSVFDNVDEKRMVPDEIDRGGKLATHEAKDIVEEIDSIGEIMKSPIDDESSDYSPWIDLGQSPSSSENSGLVESGKVDFHVPNSCFFEKKNQGRLVPKVIFNDDHYMSNDASVLSIWEDENQIKRDVNEDHSNLIEEEIDKEAIKPHLAESASTSDHKFNESDLSKEILESNYESTIRRETEFEFILSDRRGGKNNKGDLRLGHRFSLNLDDHTPSKGLIHYLESEESSSHDAYDSGYDDQESKRREPEIVCRHIDHINMIDIDKTTKRIQYLVNWLVGSLLHLRLSSSHRKHRIPLVCIYGPKIKKYVRGATLAFNVRNKDGGLIHPEIVQKLADRNGIHLGVGFLSNIKFDVDDKAGDGSLCNFVPNSRVETKDDDTFRLEVVIASLGFLTNFSDVYKLWAFVVQFLDPSFVEMSET